MRSLLCAFAVILCLTKVDAANLRLNGDLTWNVTKPQCGFRLKGQIENLSTADTGTIRLVLWATRLPYPSAGDSVGEVTLGQLPGRYQFTDFTFKTKANVPFTNGEFYFTIAVMEYTTAGWRNQLLVPTGTKALFQGDFLDQKKWRLPRKSVVAPPRDLEAGSIIKLTEKATNTFNKFPWAWRDRTKMTVLENGKMELVNRSRELTAPYKYYRKKRKFGGRKVATGNLTLQSTGANDTKFKQQITLFFHRPNAGTYRSVVTGYVWNDSFGSSTTWGSFLLK